MILSQSKPLTKSKKLLILLSFILFFAGGWWLKSQISIINFDRDVLYLKSGTRMWPINIEIAKTEAQRQQGLKQRRRVASDAGMLFIFPKPQVATMWMRDTWVPLDILFINKFGVIEHVVYRTKPRSDDPITYDKPVVAVLELPAGSAKKRMIGVGDLVVHPHIAALSRLD